MGHGALAHAGFPAQNGALAIYQSGLDSAETAGDDDEVLMAAKCVKFVDDVSTSTYCESKGTEAFGAAWAHIRISYNITLAARKSCFARMPGKKVLRSCQSRKRDAI